MILRPIFKGSYEGKNIWSYKDKLDYSIDNIEDRIDLLYDILNVKKEGDYEFTDDLFWREVWDSGVCKVDLNTTDPLWSETNVALTLETMGTYILTMDSEENKTEYKIFREESDFQKALAKEKRAIMQYGDNISFDETKQFKILIPNGNFKLDPKPTVKKSDLEKYPLLKDYQDYLDYLSEVFKTKEGKKELAKTLVDKGVTRYSTEPKIHGILAKTIGDVRKDMLDVKNSKERPIKWKQPLKDSGYKSYEELDMFDKDVVAELLRVHRDMEIVDFQDDLNCILFDLNVLIEECEFTKIQQQVLDLYSRGMTLEHIGERLNMKKPTVNQHINGIVKKIINQYEVHYADWYYLEICKGEYQKCTQCGEIKLVQNFDKNGKRGYMSMCKNCRKK